MNTNTPEFDPSYFDDLDCWHIIAHKENHNKYFNTDEGHCEYTERSYRTLFSFINEDNMPIYNAGFYNIIPKIKKDIVATLEAGSNRYHRIFDTSPMMSITNVRHMADINRCKLVRCIFELEKRDFKEIEDTTTETHEDDRDNLVDISMVSLQRLCPNVDFFTTISPNIQLTHKNHNDFFINGSAFSINDPFINIDNNVMCHMMFGDVGYLTGYIFVDEETSDLIKNEARDGLFMETPTHVLYYKDNDISIL
jgi:hypothetical protein